jgi:hypothetical protein
VDNNVTNNADNMNNCYNDNNDDYINGKNINDNKEEVQLPPATATLT